MKIQYFHNQLFISAKLRNKLRVPNIDDLLITQVVTNGKWYICFDKIPDYLDNPDKIIKKSLWTKRSIIDSIVVMSHYGHITTTIIDYEKKVIQVTGVHEWKDKNTENS